MISREVRKVKEWTGYWAMLEHSYKRWWFGRLLFRIIPKPLSTFRPFSEFTAKPFFSGTIIFMCWSRIDPKESDILFHLLGLHSRFLSARDFVWYFFYHFLFVSLVWITLLFIRRAITTHWKSEYFPSNFWPFTTVPCVPLTQKFPDSLTTGYT